MRASGRRRSASIGPRTFWKITVGLGVGVVLAAVPPSVVSAHAIVVSIQPADGSALAVAPEQIVVTFSEPMLADGLTVAVTARDDVASTAASAALDAADPARVIVRLASGGDGTYQVRVTARDAEDLHEVVARTSFAVGAAAPPPSAPTIAGPEPLETTARWMFAAGLALMVGVTAVRTRWPDVPIGRPRRLGSLAFAGVTAAFVGRVGILAARAVSLGGPPLDAARTVLTTTDGRRLVPVLVAVGCFGMTVLPGRAPWLDMSLRRDGHLTCRQALGWLGAFELAAVAGWGGHSALDGSTDVVAVLAKSAHFLGIGLWVGVLAVVLVVSDGPVGRRSALMAMSEVAVFGALLTVVSGLVMASRLVVSITALASTPFGLMLALKIALIGVAVVLGVTMQRADRSRRSTGELVVLTVAVLLGAAMATATPAIDRGFTDATPTPSVQQPAIAADDLLMQVRAIPAHPGLNSLELRLAETRRPPLGELTSVDIASGDESWTTTPTAAGLVLVDAVDLPAGVSSVEVVVHRRGWPDTTANLEVATSVPVWVHEPVISSRSTRVPLLALAALTTLIGGIGLGRRRRSSRTGHGSRSDALHLDVGAGDDTGPGALTH